MSNNNKSSIKIDNNKKKREPASKIATRIIAIILVLLMLSGSIYYVFQFLFIHAHASAQEFNPDNLIRVGLMYGNGVTVGFETTAEHGFALGFVDAQNSFTPITQVADNALSVTSDCNLTNTNRTFAKTESISPAVGGYHIEITGSGLSNNYNNIAAALAGCGFAAFPAYINGEFRIRAGSFGTLEAAQIAVASLPNGISSMIAGLSGTITAASPSPTALSVINPSANAILFELDSSDRSVGLGMTALQSAGGEKTYLITPAKNKYEGVFEFKRTVPTYNNGVALTNIVTLEEYTTGVLPYEIGSSWPLEAQKAFAVAVRSYALSHLNKHYNTYGFDVCNGTDCQLYRGAGGASEIARQAVVETAAQVMSYAGKIVSAFFSSSTGGTTVSAADAWGSNPASYPYLAAKPTPWERYAEHNNGEWMSEATPTELYNTLRAKGYTLLRGPIASVMINSTPENSTYATSVTFIDVYGTSITITRSDTIRSVLGAHVLSANFKVALAGQTVALKDYYYADAADVFGISGKSGSGIAAASVNNGAAAKGNNIKTLSEDKRFILPSNNELGIADPENNADPDFSSMLPKLSELKITESTRYVTAAGAAGSFVFVGRGYGHGVGMSQWGAYDLAKLGYGYGDILTAYYNGIKISDYRDSGDVK